ncbi:MAG: FHA domain-containing protein [Planctomycetota bacterium]|nr:MAG: FHA domain-containing protein [Planctomycetota bacterium]REK21991.1 MAG: FHA domain-containing protein [Planctomycetota bacterium]REK31261.1 MAG: FHA domain-containing protein [Planctomycetota bacterium]
MTSSTDTAWILVGEEQYWSQIYKISGGRVTRVGRSADNDIVLADSRCSRHHCEVAVVDGAWMIRDCKSRNGTYVWDREVGEDSPAKLRDWDEIRLGPHRLVFTTDLKSAYDNPASGLGETMGDTEVDIPTVNLTAEDTILPRRKGEDRSETSRKPDLRPRAPISIPFDRATRALIGESPAMNSLLDQIRRIAPTDATVLIRGESGVGKELVARALHEHSRRLTGPFVCLNCAALNETLLESELFGHEKGAFTGAAERKLGKFELADTGTLFLDEVGELSQSIQAKFLRVLEGQPFTRIGGSDPIRADVRLLAATNRDLEVAVKEQKFREDLYFRLHVVQIPVPPLRQRKSDIPLLVEHFVEQSARQAQREPPTVGPAAMDRLCAYHWPGNVRELKNTIHRAVIFAAGDAIELADLRFSSLDLSDTSTFFTGDVLDAAERSLEEVELSHILATLEHTGWNKSRAAEILGIERSTLDRKLKRHNIQRPQS